MAIDWQVTGGSLPPGLNIVKDSTTRMAYIRGNPTRVGTYTFELTVTDIENVSDKQTFTIVVDTKLQWAGYIHETLAGNLPSAEVGSVYNITNNLMARELGASAERTFTVDVINDLTGLPPGLTVTKVDNALITPDVQVGSYDYAWVNFSGTPTTVGTYRFKLRLSNGTKTVDTVPFTIVVAEKQQPPPPPPPVVPVYTLVANTSNVNEGSTVRFTLRTEGVASGTVIPFEITGISAADVTDGLLSGNFTVTTRIERYWLTPTEPEVREITSGFIDKTITADLTTEGVETMTLALKGVSPATSVSVAVSDTSVTPDPPTYALYAIQDSSIVTSVVQGTSFDVVLVTTNLSDNKKIYYKIASPTSYMLMNGSLTGAFDVVNNTATLNVATRDDSVYGPLTFKIELYTDSSYTTKLGVGLDVELTDPAPTYTLTLNNAQGIYDETDNNKIVIDLTTTNVPNNTLVPWNITPSFLSMFSLSTADFVDLAQLSGNFTVVNNFARLTLNIKADQVSENEETFFFILTGKDVSKAIAIKNTSSDIPIIKPVYSVSFQKKDTDGFAEGVYSDISDSTILVEGQAFRAKISAVNPNATYLAWRLKGTGVEPGNHSPLLSGLLTQGSLMFVTSFPTYVPFWTSNDGVAGQKTLTFEVFNTLTAEIYATASIKIDSPPVTNPDSTLPGTDDPVNDPGNIKPLPGDGSAPITQPEISTTPEAVLEA